MVSVEDGTKYLLVRYRNGKPSVHMGRGGQARIYETLKMARRYAPAFGAKIVALELDQPNLHIREVEDDDDR